MQAKAKVGKLYDILDLNYILMVGEKVAHVHLRGQ